MAQGTDQLDELTMALAMAVKHMRHRLRAELGADSTGFTMPQLTILWYLHKFGPSTISSLAKREGVSQQAVSQLVPDLKKAGLIASQADPADGRKLVLSITDQGKQLREDLLRTRNEWLSNALSDHTTTTERRLLTQAAELLERLASLPRTNH